MHLGDPLNSVREFQVLLGEVDFEVLFIEGVFVSLILNQGRCFRHAALII
jgi:hypothetical protein